MSCPFDQVYFSWAIPLLTSGWGIVTIATPPGSEEDLEVSKFPYVTGNLEDSIRTLTSLVEGARNPGPNMLPVRLVTLPSHLSPRYFV